MTIFISAAIATLVSGFIAYCLDNDRRVVQQREYAALHDQVATLELRVRKMEELR